MASTHKHIRSGTANKRPTTAIADGQIALNTNSTSPGLFFKDSTGATIIKIGPVHVGATAPNVSPAAGGSSGNSTGEIWLDNSLTPVGVKIWNGSAWVNATPIGSTTVQGLLELATDAETQAGSDTARAVTPASLQSKVSDSTSTTSSTTIASSTAVKSAYDLANAALPKSGGTVTGNLEIGNTGSLSFEGATADGFETTIAITDPTADRTITLPDTTGTVVLNTGAQTVQFGLGAAATPSITFTGDTNTGIYSPGADQVAISTGGTGRLFINSSGYVGVGVASPSVALDVAGSANVASRARFEKTGTGKILQLGADRDTSATPFIGSESNHDFTFITNNTERMRLDSSGRLGLGTSSPGQNITIQSAASGTAPTFKLQNPIDSNSSEGAANNLSAGQLLFGATGAFPLSAKIESVYDSNASFGRSASLIFSGANGAGTLTERMRIDVNGRVGIGSTTPGNLFVVSNGGAAGLEVDPVGTNSAPRLVGYNRATSQFIQLTLDGLTNVFATSGTERARIDSSGRLLVGTSLSTNVAGIGLNGKAQFAQNGNAPLALHGYYGSGPEYGGDILLTRSRSNSIGTNTIVQNGDDLGTLFFAGANGTGYDLAASIGAFVDSTPGASNDMPGRLVFSTTADGSVTPTERMRISSGGAVGIGKTPDFNPATNGFEVDSGACIITRAGGAPLFINRNTDDGTLVSFRQAATEEGTISVSGTTVSYNGAHLSRWSQLPSGTERTEILRGTVLSNIDEMCTWGDEDNEQLNRMKVSDVEGDPNVSGVFQAWDDDDDTYTDDFYCAMTGDFIIRIAEGVTVQRGDLLMSAGDGTAKPQDDDIIHSKTVAKVTSTHVTCTYNDGSYCVPCVLMAC